MVATTITYGANTAFTVTNLHSIATSSTRTAGWTSAAVDNTSTLALDYLVSGKVTVGTSPTSDPGVIEVWAYAPLDGGTTYPDLFSSGTEGTEGTATVHDTEQKSGLRLLWSTFTDTTTNDVHNIAPTSVKKAFGGVMPPKFALFVTHSTGVNLHSSGNALYYQSVKYTIA